MLLRRPSAKASAAEDEDAFYVGALALAQAMAQCGTDGAGAASGAADKVLVEAFVEEAAEEKEPPSKRQRTSQVDLQILQTRPSRNIGNSSITVSGQRRC